MVRRWNGGDSWGGGDAAGFGGVVWATWGALLALVLVISVVFSCAGGASQDKAAAANSHADTYGGAACAGACGAACGG
ncbi:UNVERIFIED_CONTAM: hypothetical protein Sangu_1774700 [Sesamum angustifolium]|uniref:Uncharacterized protein n=1 Tax=Sesamum angustifolium TaxID=2727405 RepID=A0AAW2M9G3_9LAMI